MSIRAALLLPLTVLAGRAMADELPSMQEAAGDCARSADGWLTCGPATEAVLECACATAASPARDAYFVKVDADTTTQHFDGRLLVARDLTGEQSVSLWFDEAATPDQVLDVYRELVQQLQAALDAGLSEDLAVETAAAGAMGTHEVGHWIGLYR